MRIIAGCAWQLELSHQCLQIRGRAHLNSGEPKIPHGAGLQEMVYKDQVLSGEVHSSEFIRILQ